MNTSKPLLREQQSSSAKKPAQRKQQYDRFFVPQPGALRSAVGAERFDIFTLTDFSIPVYLASGSGAMSNGK